MNLSRRKFIKKTGITVAGIPIAPLLMNMSSGIADDKPLDVHLFSKHLQFLDIKEAAEVAAELGFNGLDLTVRPKGHVLPEDTLTDLPKAISDINSVGSSCKMITTAITDINNAFDLDIIQTAAKHHVQFYRMNWYKYHEEITMEESIAIYQEQIKNLGEINKQHNIIGCYQNHAGTKVGASYWEINQLLESVNIDYFGVQYDIRHAMVDGGLSWQNGLKLLNDNIQTIVLKDYKWAKVNGKYKVINVPIGEGMVDFIKYFKLLKSYGLNPPVSLHLEYDLGGAEKGRSEFKVDKKVVFDAMRSDLKMIQKLWKQA
ncbi:sugar phosphate isomerase/epimerase family protein [Winogradskyella endarachnes]|uniref:TIM barrel protein n=1 Tax=Winogradskyella endarachnes TaxID=2681965 RepID=A0A6L6U4I4_9FLAO|nr:TIM barrel protein [Winogradskyella endarachnes]MUU76993.1 TIM barrel protein [Winogradskyella endarachnes]